MNAEKEILESWQVNAHAWTNAIAQNEIESRLLVTNQAIIDAALAENPFNYLDLGCGEGWLCRAIATQSKEVQTIEGWDAIESLITNAKQLSSPNIHYRTISYQAIIGQQIDAAKKFNLISINFALFENELVKDLLQAIKILFAENGTLIIQTLHPVMACGDLPYQSGWREGSWAGFSNAFSKAHPWYFRTLENWVQLFTELNYSIKQMKEPLHPKTGKPASVIFVLENNK